LFGLCFFTTAEACETTLAEPEAFEAVITTRKRVPTSAEVSL